MIRPKFGPGRPSTHGKVEEHKSIDIRWMAREGLLVRGKSGAIVWSSQGHDTEKVRYEIGFDDMVTFRYSYAGHNGLWQPVERRLDLTHSEQYLGGQRPWMICPECGKRVAIVYIDDARIACRLCLDLVYASQSERYFDRADRMANRVLAKLIDGGDQVLKPKRMRWATFDRLYRKYIELQDAASEGMFLTMARLLKGTQ